MALIGIEKEYLDRPLAVMLSLSKVRRYYDVHDFGSFVMLMDILSLVLEDGEVMITELGWKWLFEEYGSLDVLAINLANAGWYKDTYNKNEILEMLKTASAEEQPHPQEYYDKLNMGKNKIIF